MKMRTPCLFILALLTLVALPMAGCSLRASLPTPIVTDDSIYTQAAQTIVAALTQSIAPATPVPPTQRITELPAVQTVMAGLTQGVPIATLDLTLPVFTQAPEPTASSTPSAVPTLETTPTQEPTATPAPTATPTATSRPATVVFEDDFSTGTGWHTEAGEDFGFRYARGGYRIYINIEEAPAWSVRSFEYGDVILEVDGARTSGPNNGFYGLVCRHQDNNAYYALVISSDGSYGIARRAAGNFEFIQEGTAESGVIRGDDEFNRIRAECIGETLALYANGQLLAEVQDDQLSSGTVGLIAGTRRLAGLEVLFDNFAILEP